MLGEIVSLPVTDGDEEGERETCVDNVPAALAVPERETRMELVSDTDAVPDRLSSAGELETVTDLVG